MVVALFLSIFPSFISVPIRRLLGHKIGRGSCIKIGSILRTDENLIIGTNTSIGPFSCLIAQSISIGNNTKIKPLSIIKANSIIIGSNAQVSPFAIINGALISGSSFELGNHSQVFPFCWLEPGEGITIGNHVGIGGHSLIFTHGSWSNYLNGGPVSFGPVIIKDNVWLPWRVFVLPNTIIGENAVIAAHSVVSKNIPANSLAAGSPAKIIKENFIQEPNDSEKLERLQIIITHFKEYQNRTNQNTSFEFSIDDLSNTKLNLLLRTGPKIQLDEKQLNYIDFEKNIFHIINPDMIVFTEFLRQYGIRLTKV